MLLPKLDNCLLRKGECIMILKLANWHRYWIYVKLKSYYWCCMVCSLYMNGNDHEWHYLFSISLWMFINSSDKVSLDQVFFLNKMLRWPGARFKKSPWSRDTLSDELMNIQREIVPFMIISIYVQTAHHTTSMIAFQFYIDPITMSIC